VSSRGWLGVAIAVVVIMLATMAHGATPDEPPSDNTKPPACHPVIVHIKRNTIGCQDIAPLNEIFRRWKTKEEVERADEKTFNRVMDGLERKGCFWFKKGGPNTFDLVDIDEKNQMVQIVVFWKGRHQLMWIDAGTYRVDPKQKQQCAAEWGIEP
jgi:hypothetical protein